jgi:IS30 family transposase
MEGLVADLDNGKEFLQFKELESKTGLTVYFADPYRFRQGQQSRFTLL